MRCDGNAQRAGHGALLAVSGAVVLLTVLLQIRADQRLEFRWWPGLALPDLCTSRSCLGINCPGCGLTRSLVQLAHGDWKASLAAHRLGWLIGLVVLFQVPYRGVALLRKEHVAFDPRVSAFFLWALVALLAANWMVSLSRVAA